MLGKPFSRKFNVVEHIEINEKYEPTKRIPIKQTPNLKLHFLPPGSDAAIAQPEVPMPKLVNGELTNIKLNKKRNLNNIENNENKKQKISSELESSIQRKGVLKIPTQPRIPKISPPNQTPKVLPKQSPTPIPKEVPKQSPTPIPKEVSKQSPPKETSIEVPKQSPKQK